MRVRLTTARRSPAPRPGNSRRFVPGTGGSVALHFYGCIGRSFGGGERGPWPTFFLGITRKDRTVSATDTQLEAVRAAVEPAVVALGLAVYDVELLGGAGARTLRLTVTGDGASISRPSPRSPTRSRPSSTTPRRSAVRTCSRSAARASSARCAGPSTTARALGEEVSVKFHTGAGPRRVRGVLRRVRRRELCRRVRRRRRRGDRDLRRHPGPHRLRMGPAAASAVQATAGARGAKGKS